MTGSMLSGSVNVIGVSRRRVHKGAEKQKIPEEFVVKNSQIW